MKKSLLYGIICGSCFAVSTGLTLIANGIESANSNPEETLIATTNTIDTTPKSFNQNETVYLITDHSGAKNTSFVGNTINQSNEPIPVDMKITYTLDGNVISAEELAGKSGHIKITYDFAATKYYANQKIPFLTVTGLLLDSNRFSNVTAKNGKIISESETHTIIAGYAIVGLNENLNIDILPTSFSFEADVKDFALETTYTFATSELFADLDTSKLSSVDDIIDKLNQLSSSFDQIVNGGNSLASGLDAALNGAGALQAGLNTLTSGAKTLANGAGDLADGAHQLESGAYQISNGLDKIVSIDNQILDKIREVTAEPIAKYNETIERIDQVIEQISKSNPDLATELTKIKTELETKINTIYEDAYSKVTEYTGGIEKLADGANKLAAGLTTLSNGADSLASGTNQLANGATELSLGSSKLVNGLGELANGGHTLSNGLIAFKEQGIDKLTNLANNDLQNLISNIRSSVNAARSHHYYQNPAAKSVKYIFKTPSIK